MLRGFHSKRSSSTASRTAATGDAKVADIPPAAPATSRVFRSALVSLKNCASIEPKAPPVMMIAAAADEDGLEGFRNSLAADALRPVAGHEADDERSGDRDQDHEPAERVARRGDERDVPPPEEGEVREQADQPEERQGHP